MLLDIKAMGKFSVSGILGIFSKRIECCVFVIACICGLCVSCTSLHDRNNWFVGSGINYSIVPLALNGSTRGGYFDEETHSFSEDAREYWSDRIYVENLEKKLKEGIDTVKNKQLISEIDEILQSRRNVRVSQRMDFLKAFYADLSQMNVTDFTQKYKKHCSRGVLKHLKEAYQKEFEGKGYAWNLFTDTDTSHMKDYSISYMDDNWEHLNEDAVDFMYGSDTLWVKNNKHAYLNEEDKWYSITTDKHQIMVMVEGQDNHIAITGILNAYRDLELMTEYDR